MKQLVRIKRWVTTEIYVDRDSYKKQDGSPMSDDEVRSYEMDITDDQFMERIYNEYESPTSMDASTVVTFEDIL